MLKRRIIYFVLIILLASTSITTAAEISDVTTVKHNNSVYINDYLVFEDIVEQNGAFYVKLRDLIAFLNIEIINNNTNDNAVYLKQGKSFQKAYELGPFKSSSIPIGSSIQKYMYFNDELLNIYTMNYKQEDYVDLKGFSMQMDYNFSLSNNKIQIQTNDYKKIKEKSKIRIVVLPSSLTNVTASFDIQKMDKKIYDSDIALPLADATYTKLVSSFESKYGDSYDFVTIDRYLMHKRLEGTLDKAVDLLASNIKYLDLSGNIDTSGLKIKTAYGSSFELNETNDQLTPYSTELLEDILETENAQGVIYTSMEQIGSNYNFSNDQTFRVFRNTKKFEGNYSFNKSRFYFKYNGFCFMKDGSIIPLENNSYNYSYVRVVNELTNEIEITATDNKTMLSIFEPLVKSDAWKDTTVPTYQLVVAMQNEQALKALNEIIPMALQGVQYYLLSDIDGDEYASYIKFFEYVRNTSKIENISIFNKKVAELLLKNGLYKDAARVIGENNPDFNQTPEYIEMKAIEKMQEGNYVESGKQFDKLMQYYKKNNNEAMVEKVAKKIAYLNKLYIKDLVDDNKFKDVAEVYKSLILEESDTSKSLEYTLLVAENYEKAGSLRNAVNWYNSYLTDIKGDSLIENKVHDLSVKLGIDDLTPNIAIKFLQPQYDMKKIKYYLVDYDKNKFKDIIVTNGNSATVYTYVKGEYVPYKKDVKADKEKFEDIDKDGIVDITYNEGISTFSGLKLNEPFIIRVKSRKLFTTNYTVKESYASVLKTKEAAVARFFDVILKKNEIEYKKYPVEIRKFVETNNFKNQAPTITMSKTKATGNNITMIVKKKGYDNSVTFVLKKVGAGYVLSGVSSVKRNNEDWF